MKIFNNSLVIQELVLASLRSRFRQTWGGLVWVLLNPLITYIVHCFILAKVLNINLPNLPIYLLGGVLPWSFFSTTLEMSPTALKNSRELIHSFSISPFTIIAIIVVENFVTFLMSFTVLAIALSFFYQLPLQNIYFLPFAAMLFFIFTFFVSISIAILNVFYRDIRFIVSFAMSILFFLTPILYSEKKFPTQYIWIVNYNPLYKVLLLFRACIYEFETPLSFLVIVNALITIFLVFLLTVAIWNKYKNELAKQI
jgi:ABC-type polysaccharide/polyol phosphate export permease